MKALAAIILTATLALFAAGCNGGEQLSKTETETLKDNLNKPVDVEKIRAEWAAKHGKTGTEPTGAANPDEQ